MNFVEKFNRKRKAISPIIGIVLLIALTVAAGAVVWATTNNLISFGQSDQVIIENVGVGDQSNNDLGDLLRIVTRNIGTEEATIIDINVFVNDQQATSWVLDEETYSIVSGGQAEVFASTIDSTGMVTSQDDLAIQLVSEDGVSNTYDVSVPQILASEAILYDSGSGITTEDLAAQGWTQIQIADHAGGSGQGFEVVPENPDKITVTTNNDLLFILQNDSYSLQNFILSTDISNGDNDFLGMAFRYIDENNYYWVGVTSDHLSSDNRDGDPLDENIPYTEDQTETIVFGKVEAGVTSVLGASAVDPSLRGDRYRWGNDPDDVSWIKNFQLIVSDDTFSMQVDGDEMVSVTDTTFPDPGYVGFIALASQNSQFANIIIQR